MLLQAMDRALEWIDAEAREDDSAETSRGCGHAATPVEHDSVAPHADGSTVTEVETIAETNAIAEAALAHDSAESCSAGAAADRPALTARRADALGVLAERFLAVAPDGDEGLQTSDRFLVTVHAPAARLRAVAAAGGLERVPGAAEG